MFFLKVSTSALYRWFMLFYFSSSKPNLRHSDSRNFTMSVYILCSLDFIFLVTILEASSAIAFCSFSVRHSALVSYFWNSILSVLVLFLFSLIQKLVLVFWCWFSLLDFLLFSLIILMFFFASFIPVTDQFKIIITLLKERWRAQTEKLPH